MEGRSGIMPQGEHPFKKGGPDPFDRTTDCLGPKDKERRKKLNDLLEPQFSEWKLIHNQIVSNLTEASILLIIDASGTISEVRTNIMLITITFFSMI